MQQSKKNTVEFVNKKVTNCDKLKRLNRTEQLPHFRSKPVQEAIFLLFFIFFVFLLVSTEMDNPLPIC